MAEDRSSLFGGDTEVCSTTDELNNSKFCSGRVKNQNNVGVKQQHSIVSKSFLKFNQHLPRASKYQSLIGQLTRRFPNCGSRGNSSAMLLVLLATTIILVTRNCALALSAHNHIHPRAQARVGGLDASDYIDEAGELDIMANQPAISTAQLMSAAGHLVPENFFLSGGSIPAPIYHSGRYGHHQMAAVLAAQQQQQQQQLANGPASVGSKDQDPLQVAASSHHARQVASMAASGRPYGAARQAAPIDLLTAAAEQQQQQQEGAGSLIDFNGYNLAASPDGRDGPSQMDLAEFLAGGAPLTSQQQQHILALYEQQLAAVANQQQQQHPSSVSQQQQQQQLTNEHQQALAAELAAIASSHDQVVAEQQQQQLQADNYLINAANSIGPDYQIEGLAESYEHQQQQQPAGEPKGKQQPQHNNQHNNQQRSPFGLPNKSSAREPSGMLKPIGNPKTISSPAIDFVANLPKTPTLEKLAEKLPASQTPTVFSFSSSKDPVGDKAKGVSQKKRTVMRQAEQMAKLLIKSINDKFGTNLGDQTDIPFLLSTLGPLGFAQNLLLDPTLLISLLNSAEKTYFSDVLPGPAKSAIRPVLNFFRVPNKKKDKANLLNIISYLTSGGQTGSNTSSKHRQSFGIEKSSNSNNNGNKNKNNNR